MALFAGLDAPAGGVPGPDAAERSARLLDWVLDEVPALGAGLALIPPPCRAWLAAVPARFAGQPFAPSRYLLALCARDPVLARLDPRQADERRLMALAALVLAATRPEIPALLPPGLEASLRAPGPGGAPSELARFCARLRPRAARPEDEGEGEQARAHLAGANTLHPADAPGPARNGSPRRAEGAKARSPGAAVPVHMDETGSEAGSTAGAGAAAGHLPAPQPAGGGAAPVPGTAPGLHDGASGPWPSGLEAARRMFAQAGPGPVALQILGPFGKASGLGQAVRLSALAAQAAGLAPHLVDLAIDDPGAELARPGPAAGARAGTGPRAGADAGPDAGPNTGAGTGAQDWIAAQLARLGPPRRARVNLIHLNAEMLPLAFAAHPQVFDGAWNIAFPFWEPDRAAACHALGLALVDELWLASPHGAAIFAPVFGGPVTVTGLCVPDLDASGADISGAASGTRARAQARALLARLAGLETLPGAEFVFLVAFDSFSYLQRKNPLGAVRAFRRAFPAGERGVRMVLKTHNRTRALDARQAGIWAALERELAADPRLSLIDATLEAGAQRQLMAAADAYVSLHRAEGWGFGLIEAMALGVPVLATGWSGNMAFCSARTALPVGWSRVAVAPGDYPFVEPGQGWAEPDLDDAARQMRRLRADAGLRARLTAAARAELAARFSPAAVGRIQAARLGEILGSPPPGRPHAPAATPPGGGGAPAPGWGRTTETGQAEQHG